MDRYDITNKAIQCDPSFDPQGMSWFKNSYHRLKIVTDKRSTPLNAVNAPPASSNLGSSMTPRRTVGVDRMGAFNPMNTANGDMSMDSSSSDTSPEVRTPSSAESSPSPSMPPPLSWDYSARSSTSSRSTTSLSSLWSRATAATTPSTSRTSRSVSRSNPSVLQTTTATPMHSTLISSNHNNGAQTHAQCPRLVVMEDNIAPEVTAKWINYTNQVIAYARRHQLYFEQFVRQKWK